MADKNDTDIHKPIKTAKTSISYKEKESNNYLDINELVRSIQRAENNVDCFRKGHIMIVIKLIVYGVSIIWMNEIKIIYYKTPV